MFEITQVWYHRRHWKAWRADAQRDREPFQDHYQSTLLRAAISLSLKLTSLRYFPAEKLFQDPPLPSG